MIGPVYRGSGNVDDLEQGIFYSDKPGYASEFAEGDAPVMGKYGLPSDTHYDMATDKGLRKAYVNMLSRNDPSFGNRKQIVAGLREQGNRPSHEEHDYLPLLLDKVRPDWTSTKVNEGDDIVSYLLRDPKFAKNLLGGS